MLGLLCVFVNRYGIRVNTISAGPLKSRAASAIGGDGEKTFIERAIEAWLCFI